MMTTEEGPLISVVMPIFNREQYVSQAIESVLAQTYRNWELILVDDGSTDRSIAIAQQFAERFADRIRWTCHEGGANRGISATRNAGMKLSRGAYIACLDSDDLWVPDKLETQAQIALDHPEVGLIFGATNYWHPDNPEQSREIPAGGPLNCVVQPPALFTVMYPIGTGVSPSMNTVLLKKGVIMAAGGWEESFKTSYEDQAMLCRIYLSETTYNSSKICDLYRQHLESVMGTELRGIRYYRKRYIFLHWLERWLKTERPQLQEELRIVQKALNAPNLWPYRGPIRYTFWRAYKKARRKAGSLLRGKRNQ